MQQQFQATVPNGLNPGDQFQIMTPSGPVTLSVPPGHPPGSSFMFMMPAMAQPSVTMAQPVGPVVMGQPPPPQWQQPYGQQPYGAPPPQIFIQAPAPIVVNQQPRLFAVEPPPGAPPGGVYEEESYIGVATLLCCLLLLFFCWPATCAPFCCPCDQRVVYIYAGAKYTRSGQMVPAGSECCGYPCGGPAM